MGLNVVKRHGIHIFCQQHLTVELQNNLSSNFGWAPLLIILRGFSLSGTNHLDFVILKCIAFGGLDLKHYGILDKLPVDFNPPQGNPQ